MSRSGWLFLLCVGLGLWLFASQRHVSRAEAALRDALAKQAVERQAWDAERDSLADSMRVLQAARAVLMQRYAIAQTQTRTARHTLDSLLAESRDNELGNAVAVALHADSVQLASCEALRDNCEQRAQNAEARARGDSTQLAETVVLLQRTEAQWQAALHPSLPDQFWRSRALTIPLTILAIAGLIRH